MVIKIDYSAIFFRVCHSVDIDVCVVSGNHMKLWIKSMFCSISFHFFAQNSEKIKMLCFFWLILLANLQSHYKFATVCFDILTLEVVRRSQSTLAQQHENSLISECTKCENYVISHIKCECECLICFEWMSEWMDGICLKELILYAILFR